MAAFCDSVGETLSLKDDQGQTEYQKIQLIRVVGTDTQRSRPKHMRYKRLSRTFDTVLKFSSNELILLELKMDLDP